MKIEGQKEHYIEEAASHYARTRHRCLVRKLHYPGRRGAPDRVFFFPSGQVLFIEFKRSGGRRSPAQVREIGLLQGHRQHAYFADSLAEAKELIDHVGAEEC